MLSRWGPRAWRVFVESSEFPIPFVCSSRWLRKKQFAATTALLGVIYSLSMYIYIYVYIHSLSIYIYIHIHRLYVYIYISMFGNCFTYCST